MFNLMRKAGRALFASSHHHEETDNGEMPRVGPDDLPYFPNAPPIPSASHSNIFQPHHHHQMVEYYPPPLPPAYYFRRFKQPKLPPRSCAHESQTVIALLCFCIAIIVKGVAYGNSHWTNHDELDYNNNKEQFPVMTNFIDMTNGKYDTTGCDDMKCKIFFDKYNAMQMVAQAKNKPSVPLRGTFSRGVNSRCETIWLLDSSSGGDIITTGGSSSKYEKCVVDKQTEVTEYRTVRVLMVTSMVADGLAIVVWIVIFVRPSKASLSRLAMVIAALLGFMSALLTALAVGLFTQAVDIYDDPRMTLGWPFYLTAVAGFLALAAAVIAGGMLYSERKWRNQLNAINMIRNGNCSNIIIPHQNNLRGSSSVSVIEMDNNNAPPSTSIVHSNFQAIETDGVKALPAPPPLPMRLKSREKLNQDDEKSVTGSIDNNLAATASGGGVGGDTKSVRSVKITADDNASVGRLAFRRDDTAMRSSNRSGVDSLDRDVERLYQGYRRNNPVMRSNRSAFNQAI